MRAAYLILFLILFCSVAKAENVILHRSYFGRADRVDFLVPREELRKVRPWEPAAGTDAPLSRSQALEIVRKAALAEGLDISDDSKLAISLTRTNPFEEELIKRLPPGCCRWFYLVNFMGEDAALKGKFSFLVSMSGAVASKAVAPSQ
jgi:hypothetical protein